MSNRLAAESSPYLLQHADNPVDWYPWGDTAFELARQEDRPVLLSVGYSACHWCHVMAHESFENPEIAGLMNELFVSIKVDREERPDVDSVYMSAAQAMGIHGGWPLTVFLTPGRTAVLRRHVLSTRGSPGPARLPDGAAGRGRCIPRAARTRSASMGEKVREAVAPRRLPDAGEPTAALLDAAALASSPPIRIAPTAVSARRRSFRIRRRST